MFIILFDWPMIKPCVIGDGKVAQNICFNLAKKTNLHSYHSRLTTNKMTEAV